MHVPQRRPTQDDRQDHRSHAGYGRGYDPANRADFCFSGRMLRDRFLLFAVITLCDFIKEVVILFIQLSIMVKIIVERVHMLSSISVLRLL